MTFPAFQRLQRVIELEEKQGWRNRAVVGGMGAMAQRWQGDALEEGADAPQVQGLVALLRAYDKVQTDDRPALLETLKRTAAGSASDDEIEAALARAGVAAAFSDPEPSDDTLPDEAGDAIPDDAIPDDAIPDANAQDEDDFPVIAPPEATDVARKRVKRRQNESNTVLDLDVPVTRVNGIGKAAAELLAKLNIQTVRDLLWHFPARYDDYSTMRTVSEIQPGEQATVIANLWDIQKRKLRHNREMLIGTLADATGTMRATWYNKWLEKQLKPEMTLRFSGKVSLYMGHKTFESPVFEEIDREYVATGRITPVYPLTEGLTNSRMRSMMQTALDAYADGIQDPLPEELRARYNLLDLPNTVQQIHFPDDANALDASQRRIAFEEMLYVQIGVAQRRKLLEQASATPLENIEAGLQAFAAALPFNLTGAQDRVLAEVGRDLARSRPMTRLIQGDVGSGKTAVAAAAMYLAAANGMQSALLAPTQILAEQHHRSLVSLLEQVPHPDGRKLSVALLTGRVTGAARDSILAELAAGVVDVVVGTTALIQDAVVFPALGFVVVDEQHRFGVEQRTLLRDKGHQPHMMVMSATPIPRSLALTIYGDLDLSIIDELPPGRKLIRTKLFARLERERLYAFLRREVKAGRQAYIVYPLVEESDVLDAGAATTAYDQLANEILPDLRIALLHGRMSGADKDSVMRGFAEHEYDILVSTTVIEVGIDVPNASAILIEDAERFGLAQIHQLRGRVGRGEHESYCALISGAKGEAAQARLTAAVELGDGFALAEKDLELRGPGEFLGKRQSGMPSLRYAELTDLEMVAETRNAAQWLLVQSDELAGYPELAANVRQFWQGEGDIS